MNSCIMEMPSVTYAQKAKAYLKDNGYRCDVVRNISSCGYSIKAEADCNIVRKLLNEKGIPYKDNGRGVSSW